MRKAIVPLLTLFVCLYARAQAPFLVKDITTVADFGAKSSQPTSFIAAGNRVFFLATIDETGTELWSTDGTSAGTSLTADLLPGPASSSPTSLFTLNGTLLFTGRDVNHGYELWTSDGTAAGTRMIVDLNPGPNSSQPTPRIVLNGRCLMVADDGVTGRELWSTDGTAAGTRLVKDIVPGSGSSSPGSMTRLGTNAVLFAANGALWRTDGTTEGTTIVASVQARSLAAFGSQVLFEGFTAATGWEPWISDGTESGTRMITEIAPGTASSDQGNATFTTIGSRAVFVANDRSHGFEMWVTDGTAAGTRMLRDFVAGSVGAWDNFSPLLYRFDGRIYFNATDAERRVNIWSTDGTDEGTALVDLGTRGDAPTIVATTGDKLYVVTLADVAPRLCVSDGTASGTHALHSTDGIGIVTQYSMSPIGGKLYFSGATASGSAGWEPWVTDGTDAGTHMIANIVADPVASSVPNSLNAAGNVLVFGASDGTNSVTTGIWRSDGTPGGTFHLPALSVEIDNPIPFGTSLLFATDFYARKWIITDGTVEGTKPADDIVGRFGPSRATTLYSGGGQRLFAAVDEFNAASASLWTMTAPNGPAVRLGSGNPRAPIESGGRWFFVAQPERASNQYGLWTTDGTAAGTYAVHPSFEQSNPPAAGLAAAAGQVFLLYGTDLWVTAGSADGTRIVKSVPATNTTELRAAGRRIFFAAGGALWTSDGTEAGTVELLQGKAPAPASASRQQLFTAGDRIVFAVPGSSGANLWSSDGSVAGTRMLMKLGVDTPSAASIDGLVYFTASDDAHGAEPWVTDGTPEGTRMIADINPGAAGSNPSQFTRAGDLIYFQAFHPATGTELWAMPAEPALSVGDGRVAEGDGGTSTLRIPITLSIPARQPVTVSYASSDATARAGEDYDAVSGSVTFAPGETSKTIDVRVHGDVTGEANERFLINLSNASGARVARGTAAGVIEDDDASVDVAVSVAQPQPLASQTTLSVANAGGQTATEVAVRYTVTPAVSYSTCSICSVPQLAPAESANVAIQVISNEQLYLSAVVAARQRDAHPENNSATWTVTPYARMDKAFLTPGSTALLTWRGGVLANAPKVSDASVISLAPGPKAGDDAAFTVTALKPGTAVVSFGIYNSISVIVVAAGTTPRWPGALDYSDGSALFTADQPLHITVKPKGVAPITGATATGTIIVYSHGVELGRGTIEGTAPLDIPVYFRTVGEQTFNVSYYGDANFLPQTWDGIVNILRGKATITGGLQQAGSTAGTYALTLKVSGSPAVAPTGTLTILNGATTVATLQLGGGTSGVATVHTTLTNLPAAATLTVNYSGDALYTPASQQIRTIAPHGRPARH